MERKILPGSGPCVVARLNYNAATCGSGRACVSAVGGGWRMAAGGDWQSCLAGYHIISGHKVGRSRSRVEEVENRQSTSAQWTNRQSMCQWNQSFAQTRSSVAAEPRSRVKVRLSSNVTGGKG